VPDPRFRISAAGIHGRRPKNAIVGQLDLNFLLQRACLHGLLIVAFDPDIAGANSASLPADFFIGGAVILSGCSAIEETVAQRTDVMAEDNVIFSEL
jgi:hypothetical protein